MANNLNVSINAPGSTALNVTDNGGQNQVSQSPNPTTISWNLTGPLAQGNFVPMTAAEPGFDWIQQPPTGVFGLPQISANGNSVSITDNHTDASTNGQWIYVLRVEYQGQIYSTTYELVGPGGTINNPIIINR